MAVAGGTAGGGGPFLRAIRGLNNDLPRWMDAKRNARRWFAQMMLRAEGLAKARAPVLTGALRASINGTIVGTSLAQGAPLQGRLSVGVIYGRMQEWEHPTRAFYAYFSILDIAREIEGILEGDAASVWIGTGRGWMGTMSFNPGISDFSQGKTGGAFSRDFDSGTAQGGVAGSGRIGPGGI